MMDARPLQAAMLSWLLKLPVDDVHRSVRVLGIGNWRRGKYFTSLTSICRVAWHLGYEIDRRPCAKVKDWHLREGLVFVRYGDEKCCDLFGVRGGGGLLWFPDPNVPPVAAHGRPGFGAIRRDGIVRWADENLKGVRFTSFLRFADERDGGY